MRDFSLKTIKHCHKKLKITQINGKTSCVHGLIARPNFIEMSVLITQKELKIQYKQTLLQGGHTEGPETCEKMLSITSYQRDAD